MRVRARVNQADVNELQVGQTVRIGLDAYPALFFDGRVAQISPLGVTSVLSAKVRTFIVLVDVNGCTSEPDARSVGVARRDAGADAGRDRRPARRAPQRRRARRSSASSAAAASRIAPVTVGGAQRARSDARVRPRRRRRHRAQRAVRVAAVAIMARHAPVSSGVRATSPLRCARRQRPRRRRRTLPRRARGECPTCRPRVVTRRRVRRHARDSRRDPAAQVDRAVVADAVGRTADPEAREERHDGQAGRRRGAVRSVDAAADDPGEAVRVEAGRRRDRTGAGADADRARNRTRPR